MDWRNALRLAGDLALLGILVTLGSLPVVTAGAAVATGSHAIHHLLSLGRWPSAASLWDLFRTRVVRLLWAGPLALFAAALVVIDVAALRRGAVPGGAPAVFLVLAATALGAAWVGLRLVPFPVRRPAALVSAAGVLVLAALLAVLIHPVLVPVLAGFALFALHVLARRFVPFVDSGTPAGSGTGP